MNADMNLPKDADGDVIPFDTGEMYAKSADKVRVLEFRHVVATGKWTLVIDDMDGHETEVECTRLLMREPDSWDALEHDVMLSPDAYCSLHRDERITCGKGSFMAQDVLRRAKRLASARDGACE